MMSFEYYNVIVTTFQLSLQLFYWFMYSQWVIYIAKKMKLPLTLKCFMQHYMYIRVVLHYVNEEGHSVRLQ